MEIEIDSKTKLEGQLDLNKFEKIMRSTHLDIKRAVTESLTILKNESGWPIGYIIDVLLAELDWGPILVKFHYRTEDKLFFKMMPVKFKDKIEYRKYAKSPDFRKVILKENKKDGKSLILINSFTPDPEHNIDIWLSKSIFPYPEGEWKKTIVEEND